jgi:hypothetical protein
MIPKAIKYKTSKVPNGNILQAKTSMSEAVINKYIPREINFLTEASLEKKRFMPDKKINNGAANDETTRKETFTSPTKKYAAEFAKIIMIIANVRNSSIHKNLFLSTF